MHLINSLLVGDLKENPEKEWFDFSPVLMKIMKIYYHIFFFLFFSNIELYISFTQLSLQLIGKKYLKDILKPCIQHLLSEYSDVNLEIEPSRLSIKPKEFSKAKDNILEFVRVLFNILISKDSIDQLPIEAK